MTEFATVLPVNLRKVAEAASSTPVEEDDGNEASTGEDGMVEQMAKRRRQDIADKEISASQGLASELARGAPAGGRKRDLSQEDAHEPPANIAAWAEVEEEEEEASVSSAPTSYSSTSTAPPAQPLHHIVSEYIEKMGIREADVLYLDDMLKMSGEGELSFNGVAEVYSAPRISARANRH